MQITLTLTLDEQAAVDALVARQITDEPGLTADVLVTRLAHKMIRGWTVQEATRRAAVDQAIVTTALTRASAEQRATVLATLQLEEGDGTISEIPVATVIAS